MTVKDTLHSLHNTHRKNHGRVLLKKVSILNAGAQKLADQMARGQWRSSDFGSGHRRPNGQTFNQWWNTTYRGTYAYYTAAGENLGWAQGSSQSSHGSCSSGCTNWTISNLHHAIMIDKRWRRVGYGVAFDSRGRGYWVVHFTT
jgi:uncharacterized protein YkwD